MRILSYSVLGLALAGCGANTTTSRDASVPTSNNSHATQSTDKANTATDKTNTAINTRDRDSSAKTPIDQNENQTDIDTTANIRKRIVDRKLSVEGTNVKVITQDGKVTLRGPVPTADEKQAIEEIAKDVAGADKVDSQLEVSGK